MPTTRANGCWSRTSSASGRPVIWNGMTTFCPIPVRPEPGARTGPPEVHDDAGDVAGSLRRLDRQDRARGVQQDALRVAAEDELADRRPAAQPDHDQVVGGVHAAHQLADLVAHPRLGELVADLLQLGLAADGVVAVELAPAPVG